MPGGGQRGGRDRAAAGRRPRATPALLLDGLTAARLSVDAVPSHSARYIPPPGEGQRTCPHRPLSFRRRRRPPGPPTDAETPVMRHSAECAHRSPMERGLAPGGLQPRLPGEVALAHPRHLRAVGRGGPRLRDRLVAPARARLRQHDPGCVRDPGRLLRGDGHRQRPGRTPADRVRSPLRLHSRSAS